MAISKNIEMISNFGDTVVFNDTYIKINEINGYKNKITVILFIYKKENELLLKSEAYSFTPNLDGDNFIKQGYEYIKTLPEYADAIDC